MSSLIVEVCKVNKVDPHPHADRMAIAHVKGWTVCIGKDEKTGETQFQPGDKVVYFPPDTVIPHTLSDRMGVTKYLTPMPKDAEGCRPEASRIRVARLRGEASYGLVTKPDDPSWEIGTNVAEHYGAYKWEPPETCTDGDAETPHPSFHRYYDMENIRNFPDLFQPGEEVVVTEKIHGQNTRLGLIKDTDENGNAVWRWMAGSHDVRRKKVSTKTRRFDAVELVENLILDKPEVEVDQVIDTKDGRKWKVHELVETEEDDERVLFRATQIDKVGEPILIYSEFWECFTEEIKALMIHLSNCGYTEDPDGLPVKDGQGNNVVLFGERYGSGVQTGYWYGYENGFTGFRAFDIAVNHKYLSFDVKRELLVQFNVPKVPELWRGPFDFQEIEALAEGPSTVSEGNQVDDDSVKVGREGVVVTSAIEGVADTPQKVHDRRQLKCISFAYLARKGGSEWH